MRRPSEIAPELMLVRAVPTLSSDGNGNKGDTHVIVQSQSHDHTKHQGIIFWLVPSFAASNHRSNACDEAQYCGASMMDGV